MLFVRYFLIIIIIIRIQMKIYKFLFRCVFFKCLLISPVED
jgi:hypothetical protein